MKEAFAALKTEYFRLIDSENDVRRSVASLVDSWISIEISRIRRDIAILPPELSWDIEVEASDLSVGVKFFLEEIKVPKSVSKKRAYLVDTHRSDRVYTLLHRELSGPFRRMTGKTLQLEVFGS